MEINNSQESGVTIFSLQGRFDAQSFEEVNQNMQEVLAGEPAKLLVDLAGVDYISSAGLRVLLSAAKQVGPQGGKLVLAGLQPAVMEVFKMAGFTAIFEIHDDKAAAMNALGD